MLGVIDQPLSFRVSDASWHLLSRRRSWPLLCPSCGRLGMALGRVLRISAKKVSPRHSAKNATVPMWSMSQARGLVVDCELQKK